MVRYPLSAGMRFACCSPRTLGLRHVQIRNTTPTLQREENLVSVRYLGATWAQNSAFRCLIFRSQVWQDSRISGYLVGAVGIENKNARDFKDLEEIRPSFASRSIPQSRDVIDEKSASGPNLAARMTSRRESSRAPESFPKRLVLMECFILR